MEALKAMKAHWESDRSELYPKKISSLGLVCTASHQHNDCMIVVPIPFRAMSDVISCCWEQLLLHLLECQLI